MDESKQNDVKPAAARTPSRAEMEANYDTFRRFVYAKLREEFEQSLGELPDTDLETLARQEEAQPLAAFIDEVEGTAGGQ